MALFSMTGFARHEFDFAEDRFAWEVKSVNARNLELRLRLPNGMDFLDPAARQVAKQFVSRGNVFLNLSQVRAARQARIKVNEDALAVVVATARLLVETDPNIRQPDAASLLSVRGVLEEIDPSRDDMPAEAMTETAVGALETCLSEFSNVRAEEGERLRGVLLGQVEQVEQLVTQADKLMKEASDVLKKRLEDQVADLIGEKSLDPDRLHQEAVLLASKQDIREEIDRLVAHCEAARQRLGGSGAVGRRLDFLAQEFNREANTICSKSFDRRLTTVGLELKATIEQFREQVQNLE